MLRSWRMRGDSSNSRYSYDTCAGGASAFGNQDNKGFKSDHPMEEVGWERFQWCALQIKWVWETFSPFTKLIASPV